MSQFEAECSNNDATFNMQFVDSLRSSLNKNMIPRNYNPRVEYDCNPRVDYDAAKETINEEIYGKPEEELEGFAAPNIVSSYSSLKFDVTFQKRIVKIFEEEFKDVDFDTIACRGSSGLLVASILAYATNKGITYIRKRGESEHSSKMIEGVCPTKYILVDDFVCSGQTMNSIVDAIDEQFPDALCAGSFIYHSNSPFSELPEKSVQGAICVAAHTRVRRTIFSGVE